MEMRIRISAGMTISEKGQRIIRIPKEVRAELGYNVEEFLSFKTKDGSEIKLKIKHAYLVDAENDPTTAYVSKDIFEVLDLSNLVNENNIVELVDTITLGTDPEFFIVDFGRNEIVHPSRFFTKFGEIGYDGLLAEIRPAPAVKAKKLVSNMAYLLKGARECIIKHPSYNTNIKLAAASHFKMTTAGFHLHFGLPKEVLNLAYTKGLVLKQMVRALDYYVGVPSIIPEGIEDSPRRCAPFCTYGKTGDYRVDWRTLEYRVPGGSLLRHPDLAEGLIGIGALVMEDAVSRLRVATDNFKNLDAINTEKDLNEIYPNVPSAIDLYQTVCVPDVYSARKHVDLIYNDIHKMISYNKRKESVEKFFDNLEKPFSCYLEDNWSLNNLKTLSATGE